MTIEEAKLKVINLAESEIGLHETGDNHVPFLDGDWDDKMYGFNAQNAPWCDSWVDHLFVECFGYETGRDMLYQFDGCCGAACEPSAEYYRQHGAFYDYPEIGDQIFFYSGGCIGHTGLVESVNGSTVVTIEGNYSDSVCRNNYPIGNSNIAGYGRPNWILAKDIPFDGEITETKEDESVEAETNNITIVDPPKEEEKPKKSFVHVCRPGDELSYYTWGMQYLLKENAYWCQADGIFGSETAEWLIKFQRDHPPLVVDAICGIATWTELFRDVEVFFCSKGYGVKAVQFLLKAHDYFVYTDGIYGTQLFTQLTRFQNEHGLAPTGRVSTETWNELIKD